MVDVFVDELDLSGLGFQTEPSDTGRPGYHPATMLQLYIYGYLNRIASSRRLKTLEVRLLAQPKQMSLNGESSL